MKQLRDRVINEVNKVVVGQNTVIDSCIIALSVGGHVLLEGAPGTAKTLVAQAFAKTLGLEVFIDDVIDVLDPMQNIVTHRLLFSEDGTLDQPTDGTIIKLNGWQEVKQYLNSHVL